MFKTQYRVVKNISNETYSIQFRSIWTLFFWESDVDHDFMAGDVFKTKEEAFVRIEQLKKPQFEVVKGE